MGRRGSASEGDVTGQVRNQLYSIGIGVAILTAVVLSQLTSADQLYATTPVILLLVAGGSTILYAAGMLLFELDEGTLVATIVSPLRPMEYLWSKVLSLGLLSSLEGGLMIGVAMAIFAFNGDVVMPHLLPIVVGLGSIAAIHILLGLAVVVRYRSITDFLVAISIPLVLFQLPFLYFMGVSDHWAWLIIPTSAQGMFFRGAFMTIEPWQWAYAIVYTAAQIGLLSVWAYRSFHTHIIEKVG